MDSDDTGHTAIERGGTAGNVLTFNDSKLYSHNKWVIKIIIGIGLLTYDFI